MRGAAPAVEQVCPGPCRGTCPGREDSFCGMLARHGDSSPKEAQPLSCRELISFCCRVNLNLVEEQLKKTTTLFWVLSIHTSDVEIFWCFAFRRRYIV